MTGWATPPATTCWPGPPTASFTTPGPGDRVARVGGDEFVVILRDLASDETVEAVASRIEDSLSAPYQVGPETIRVGASVGIAHGAPGEATKLVVARADRAMYDVKRTRRPSGRQVSVGAEGLEPPTSAL